jgi:hypothetical protein
MSLSFSEIMGLVHAEESRLSVHQRRQDFYAEFDQAAVFLLDLDYENLFDPANGGSLRQWLFRCKGCGKEVERIYRKHHHRDHLHKFNKIREQ